MKQVIRTALFVPASRPERIPKALASGADAVIVDLEDAVEASAKASARANLSAFAAENPDTPLLVRVNDAESEWFDDDMAVVQALPAGSTVLLPKAESAAQTAAAGRAGHPVIPLIESARGIAALAEIAATPGVARLSFGALDLGLDLGIAQDTPGAVAVLDQVRFHILLHSRAAGLAAPIDTIYPAIKDEAGLARFAGRAREMGFGGMLCIHPLQVAVVHAAFAPSEDEVAWARRVVAAAEENSAGAFRLDGAMVDAPVIARARQLLARAD